MLTNACIVLAAWLDNYNLLTIQSWATWESFEEVIASCLLSEIFVDILWK